MISKEKQQLIQRKCDSKEVVRIYLIVGSLARVSKLLNISKVTVWRNLKTESINVGSKSLSWKKLYNTLRGRVTTSNWRKNILKKYHNQCAICKTPSNIVHHIKKLSNLRDEIVKLHPEINPFNSYKKIH